MRCCIVLLLAVLLLPAVAAQGVPGTIPYQGLLDDGGTPVTAATPLTFSLHDAATSGAEVWTETQSVTPSAEGGFAVLLGSVTSLSSIDFDAPLWLEVEVGGTPLGPRTALGSAPYALGLALPFEATASDAGYLVDIENTAGYGIRAVASQSIRGFETVGGSFENSATNGRGVVGHATAVTGTTYGVTGEVDSPNGYPGYFTGGRGVFASAAANQRAGEFVNTGGSGKSTVTLFAENNSTGAGIAGWFETNGADATLVADQDGTGDIFRAFHQGTLRFRVQNSGFVTADGQIYGKSGFRGEASDTTPLPWGGYFQSTSTTSGGVAGLATATTGFTSGGRFENFSVNGYGVIGEAKATSGTTYGVYGTTVSPTGYGVYGWALAATGPTYSGYFRNGSTSGTGVFGWAQATTGLTYGGRFLSAATSGRGVYAEASAASGTTFGVYGESASTEGVGVRGDATAASGLTRGGSFSAASPNGVGVYASGGNRGISAVATETGAGITYGGHFTTSGLSGRGVYGVATATDGPSYGVYGQSDSWKGTGVLGLATETYGATFGGRFETVSTDGRGVFGFATASSGTTYGVYGQVQSPDGFAGYFIGGQGVYTDGAYLGGGADFAEWLPLSDASSTVAPGQLVGVTAGRIGLATSEAEQVMIVSSNPAFVGNPDAEDGGALVALVGQAEVHLASSNGASQAQVGDLLVASGQNNGLAKAVSPARYDPATDGPVAGRILELTNSGTAVALVGVDEAAALREVVVRQQAELEDLQARLSRLESLLAPGGASLTSRSAE
ncbi:MAG: hypothetical protein Rubg2KO_30520 [Rubricoccaceae bacterium]